MKKGIVDRLGAACGFSKKTKRSKFCYCGNSGVTLCDFCSGMRSEEVECVNHIGSKDEAFSFLLENAESVLDLFGNPFDGTTKTAMKRGDAFLNLALAVSKVKEYVG